MRRNRMLGSLALIVIVVVALVLAIPAARQVARAQDSPAEPAMGTILQGQLPVRRAPDVAGPVIGRVTYGQRVTILSEEDGWLEIVYPVESATSGWVSAHYVQIDGQAVRNLPVAPATASPAVVVAPSLVGYSRPATFRWRWSGSVPEGINWRFDVLIFHLNATHPYKTIQVDPAEIEPVGDVYTKVADRFIMQCNSYWTVRVSQYEDGRFHTYLSESSNRQDIGVACATPIPSAPRPQPAQSQPSVGTGSGGTGDGGGMSGSGSPSATDAAPGTSNPADLTPNPTALPPGADIRPRGGSALIRPELTPDIQPRG